MNKYVMVKKKILVENSIYHIIQRAPGDELLFKKAKDRYVFIKMMKRFLPEFNIQILAYSLMPNHLHILVKITKTNLSKCMKRLFEQYALYFNKTYNRKGHVFYGVYRLVYCDTPFSVLVVSCYIHLNAFKANIVPSPFDYQWDSLQQYLNDEEDNFINKKLVLSLINESMPKAQKSYKKLIEKLCSFPYKKIINNRKAISVFYEECSEKIKFIDFIE